MKNEKNQSVQDTQKDKKTPNEISGVYVSSFIKIHDPNTKEVYLNKRGE